MADNTTTAKIYDVKVEATDALKQLAQLRLQSQELREQQKALGQVTEQNAEQYYRLDSQIKATNTQASQYQRQITQSIKLQNQQEKALDRLRTQLSLDTAEMIRYGDESENAARKDELLERIAATTEELKRQEEAYGDHRRSVGDYAKASRDLKQEIQEIADALLVMATNGEKGSEAYNNLIARASELRTAQEDVNKTLTQGSVGVSTLDGIAKNAQLAAGAMGLFTAATALFGKENEVANKSMKALQITILALTTAVQISQAAQKNSNVARAAGIVLQKLGINTTKAETKAIAAKTAMQNASTVSTKAVTAATWLWNAALAANPVMLIVVAVAALIGGVALLSGAFKKGTSATDIYNQSLEETERILKRLKAQTDAAIDAIDLEAEKAIEAARKRGAAESEVAAIELEAAKQRADANAEFIEGENERMRVQIQSVQAVIAINNKRLAAYLAVTDAEDKRVLKLQKRNEELIDQLNEYQAVLDRNARTIERTGVELATKTREVGETFKKEGADAAKVAQETADKILDIALKTSERLQKVSEERFKAENVYVANNITAQQAYQTRLFELQQAGERERLALQVKAGKLTADEVQSQYDLMALASDQFYAGQQKALNDHFAKVRQDAVSQAGKNVDEQIAEVTAKYAESMKALAELQPPVRIPGMSDEEFDRMMDEYEEFNYNRAELEKRLEDKLQADKQAIIDKGLAERVSKIDTALTKEYGDDLVRFADNEGKKLQIEAEMLEKRKAAYVEAGQSTAEVEAALAQNAAAQRALTLNRETVLAGQSAKARYDARKKYLDAELAANRDNADEVMRINNEMRDAQVEYWDEIIAKVGEYVNAASELMGGLTDFLNAQSEIQKQKVELQYKDEEQALADKHAAGELSDAEYNAESIRMQRKKDKEIAKIERDQAIRERGMKVFSVITDTAASIAASSKMGFPMAIPFVAMAGALGALQLATILAQPLPKAATGMYINGRSHAQGGQVIEAEGGEVIINKRSASMFLPILSAINQAGGGVPFTTPGSDGGFAQRAAVSGGAGMSSVEMENAISTAFERVRVVATIEDIRREDANYVELETRGNL